MTKHTDLQWEKCSIWETLDHTQYRGFDVHYWMMSFYCAYPTEGDATKEEITELLKRIEAAGLKSHLLVVLPQAHRWEWEGKTCRLKQRRDGEILNFCFEIPRLDALDVIIDGLWAETGLQKRQPLSVGRWK